MKKEQFINILKEKKVPPKYHIPWWDKFISDQDILRTDLSPKAMGFFAEMAVEKGCQAPW